MASDSPTSSAMVSSGAVVIASMAIAPASCAAWIQCSRSSTVWTST